MPLEFGSDETIFSGNCGAEEALELVDWLLKAQRPQIGLAACTHLHAALLQTLLAFKPAISAEPEDAFLRRWIMPALLKASRES